MVRTMTDNAGSEASGSLDLAGPQEHTAADWEKATAAVLRKAGRLAEDAPDHEVWALLTRQTLDGIEVAPIGSPASLDGIAPTGVPGASPFTRGRVARPASEDLAGWDIRTRVEARAPRPAAEAREQALVDLENGATSLWIDADDSTDLSAVLDGVLLDLAPIGLQAGDATVAVAERFVRLLAERGVTPAEGSNLGAAATSDADTLRRVADLATEVGALAVLVDGTAVHDRGASDAQELGWAIAAGVAALRALSGGELSEGEPSDRDLGRVAQLLEFRLAATDEQFPTIAKLRASRRLWDRALELSGVPAESRGQRQHAVTSRPMMSAFDPWVNMLRTTVAAFAAGVGGADAVTVVPFDSPAGVPDAFGRRIARNTSSLLISESHLGRVTDPAGGAYAVEKLTDDLAEAGWREFQLIERAGGLAAATADGSLDTRIAEVVATRDRQVAKRRRPITGLTEFPQLDQAPLSRPADPHADDVRRYGAAFEELRRSPVERPVFLATLGPIAAHTARATFASNLFAAGGVAVTVAGATADVDALLAAYQGERVVCLAGSDATYADWGAAAAQRLRDAGAQRVILAGKPGERTVATELIDDSCAMGVDALAFLTQTREALA